MEPLNFNLTLGQKFELERFNRVIDETTNVDDLRKISKQLLEAWFIQKATTAWVMRDALNSPLKTSINFSENHGIS